MIDPSTRSRFDAATKAARYNGLDLAEVLDKARLLATRQHWKQVQGDVLIELVNRIEETSPTAVVTLSGGDSTPNGVIRGLVEFIKMYHTGVVS